METEALLDTAVTTLETRKPVNATVAYVARATVRLGSLHSSL